MARQTIQLNEAKLRNLIAECVKNAIMEGGGYDMSTPEGRAGAQKWMHQVMSQSDPSEEAARNYAQENGFGDDENIISAFMAGVEYGRNY